VHRVADCIRDGFRPGIPQPAEWQRIGNQIDAAMIFSGTDQQRVRWAATRDVLSLVARDRCNAQLEFLDGFDSAAFGQRYRGRPTAAINSITCLSALDCRADPSARSTIAE
jgi:hypothetical protein